MKKEVLALAAATSSMIFSGQAAAQSQAPECAPVYEEDSSGDLSPQLESIISDYANHGVDVHVQILEDGTDEGITREGNAGLEQAVEYREGLAARCEWENENTINVVLSLHPRVYEIYRHGSIDTQDVTSAVRDDEDSFIADLRNYDTPFQDDIARMLSDISPFETRDTSNGNSNENDFQAPDLPDIPWGPIGIGLFGVTAVGLSGARLKRGINFKREKDDVLDGPEELHARASDILLRVYSIMKELPDDDATQLREQYKRLLPSISQFTNTKEALDSVYSSQKWGIWPDAYSLQEIAQPLLDSIADAERNLIELEIEANEVAEKMKTIDTVVATYDELLTNVSADIDGLVEAGWDLGDLPTKGLAKYNDIRGEVAKLRDQKYVDKPGDIISSSFPELGTFWDELKDLPKRLEEQVKEITTVQSAVSERLPNDISSTIGELSRLRDEYHPKCTEDIESLEEQLQTELTELQGISAKLGDLKNVKSVSKLQESEELVAKFDSINNRVLGWIDSINQRSSQLAEISERIPGFVDTIGDAIGEAEAEVGVEPDDIEEATRKTISALGAELNEFKQSEIETEKPRLLTVDEWLQNFNEKVRSLTEQAKSERREMTDLRTRIPTLKDDIESEIDRLKAYIASERSDIGSSVESAVSKLSFPGAPLGTRVEMRDTLNKLLEQSERISALRDRAESDVREAEAERRREAQRKRDLQDAADRAAAERRRNNDTYHGGGFGGGGFDFGGGGGGGSSDGGGW